MKSKTSKKDLECASYKYSDIQSQWILCEGHLNYRSVQIKMFNISQCLSYLRQFKFTNLLFSSCLVAMYYVVLAKIPIDHEREILMIYLYRNRKHKPSFFFELDEYEK